MRVVTTAGEDTNYIRLINEAIGNFLKSAWRIAAKDPFMAFFLLQTVERQRKAAQVRMTWQARGIHVPPFMLISITNQCNLKCKGCFTGAKQQLSLTEMSDRKLRDVVEEAKELGISFILIAGGEPLMRPEILNIAGDFPEIIFPLFTNGLLINERLLARFKERKNIVPLISLEGYARDTNGRRGMGVHERLQRTIGEMSRNGMFFGLSFTLTRPNFDTVANEHLIQHFLDMDCKLFFFLEYVPVQHGPENWVLTQDQRTDLLARLHEFRSPFPALFFVFPGDEDKFGGCVSGRGLIHIDSHGNVEPCPFAPHSDASLQQLSLKEALQSELLKGIRRCEQFVRCRHIQSLGVMAV